MSIRNKFDLNEMYSTLFEHNDSVLLLIDNDTGDIVHANKAACDYYHYTYDELTSLNIKNINTLDEKQVKREMEKASSEKRKYFNFIHKLGNNKYRKVEVKSIPVKINDKKYLFSTINDVTDKTRQQLLISGLFFESPNAMVVVDDEKKVLTINRSFTKLFGYTLDEVISNRLEDFVIASDNKHAVSLNIEEVFQGEVYNIDAKRKTKDNMLIDVNIVVTPYTIGSSIAGALIVYTDISEKLMLKKEIEDTKNSLQLILDSAAEGIYGIDRKGRCTFCNRSGLKLLGYSNQEELLGEYMHDKIHHSYRDGKKMTFENCKIYESLTKENGIHSNDEVFWKKDGTCFDVEFNSYPQFKNGKLIGAVITFKDYTEKRQYEEHIRYLSYHDSLTGLYNRKYFEDEMKRLDQQNNYPISIIFGDVNGLKLTNDIFGHSSGDKLLKLSANILKRVFRKKDIIARVGGDEFAILLPNIKECVVEKKVESIRKEFSKEKLEAIKCSISLGYYTKNSSQESIESIMELAEDWMYKDKIMNRKKENEEMIKNIIDTLHAKCPLEKQHSKNVSELCYQIGIAMGKKETELRKLKDAGYLHDIGKIVLSEDVLKASELSKQQKKQMEQHPVIGYRILNLFDETLELAEGILNHHEYWDGSGYPKGIKGDEIPELARIITVVEAYDTIIYKKHGSKTKEDVLKELKEQAGVKLDAKIVDIFINMIKHNHIKLL